MAEAKTRATDASVEAFLARVPNVERRKDCQTVLGLMRAVTKCEPRMWGTSIVGFGTYIYKYESGREGEWPVTGFSPRKTNLTLYIMPGVELYPEILARLGKYKTGKSCLYIKKLDDVKLPVLKELLTNSVKTMSSTSWQELVTRSAKADSGRA